MSENGHACLLPASALPVVNVETWWIADWLLSGTRVAIADIAARRFLQ